VCQNSIVDILALQIRKKEVHYCICACAQVDGVVLIALGGDKTEKSKHKLTTAEV
jgi:hypothetical protein